MAVHDSDDRVVGHFAPLVALPRAQTLVIHSMLHVVTNPLLPTFRYGSSYGANLLLILPTFIRDARYQGDASNGSSG
jgi:hypothetical protein